MLTNNTDRVIRVVMFFKPLIALWTVADLAADLGIPQKNVRRWIDNDSIPSDWFSAVVRAAAERGFQDITAERLAEVAEKRRLSREVATQDAERAA